MHADLKGALESLDLSWRTFEHNGKPLSKLQVKAVLQYGIFKGYKTTADFKEGEIDNLLNIKK